MSIRTRARVSAPSVTASWGSSPGVSRGASRSCRGTTGRPPWRQVRLRDTLRRMETFEALRERVIDRFEALGPIELKGVADPVPLFRAASS